MNIPSLQIRTTSAQIGLSTTPGQLSIEQPPATLDLKQPKAKMNMSVTPSVLTIDQTQAWADVNHKHIFQRIREAAQEGQQKALEGTGRRAAEGRELADVQRGSSAIVQQAIRNSTRKHEVQLAFVPSHGSVKIHYKPRELTIKVQPQQVENHTRANKPVINYQPGDVNVQLKQAPSIDFQMVNKTI